MSERQGIEIDYCPKCRGIWLDRGELDKLIERSERQAAPAPGPWTAPAQPQPQGWDRGYDRHGSGHGGGHDGGRGRRRSWLGELFD